LLYVGVEATAVTLERWSWSQRGGAGAPPRHTFASLWNLIGNHRHRLGWGDPGVGPHALRLVFLTTETKWDKAYNRHSSVERVNSRIDKLLGFERHSIRGQRKMKVRMGLGVAVMLAMALGRIEAGQPEQMRAVTLPVCRAA
jgi:hypothetical protein